MILKIVILESNPCSATFEVVDPATQSVLGNVPDCGVEDVQIAIDAAAEAFKTWRETPARDRSNLLKVHIY